MSDPTEPSRTVVVKQTSTPGVFRLICRRCDLGLDVRLSGRSLTQYQERADAFLAAHDHDDDASEQIIELE